MTRTRYLIRSLLTGLAITAFFIFCQLTLTLNETRIWVSQVGWTAYVFAYAPGFLLVGTVVGLLIHLPTRKRTNIK